MDGSYERGIRRRQYRLWCEAAPEWSRAVVLALLITVVPWSGVAGESTTPDDSSVAALVLRRFIIRQAEASGWPVETIEIEASLPTLKTGRLLAIRRLLPRS